MKRNLTTFLLFFSLCTTKAQDLDASQKESNPNIGWGFGLDYGGIGGRFTYLPAKQLGLFLGVGYAFVGIGYNVGANIKFSHGKKITPYLAAMYGYNAFIKAANGASGYDKIYYGPSAGLGFEIKSSRKRKNYFNIEFLIPFRSQEYYDGLDAIKKNPYLKFNSEPPPIAFSIGYHFW